MALLRTFLFTPGNHPRRVEKCLSLPADAAILDLEDAVPELHPSTFRRPAFEQLSDQLCMVVSP